MRKLKSILSKKVRILKYQIPLGFIIGTVLLSGISYAIWLAGWNLTGNVIVVSGESPPLQAEVWHINTSTSTELNGNNTFTYTNDDGSRPVDFYIIENITSSDVGCNYEDQDIEFYIDVNSIGEEELVVGNPSTYTMDSGSNTVFVRYQLHPYHCGLTGDYKIEFVI